jgi:CheY-like chemotaxis protein
MPAPAVVIAASNLMPSLRERLADDGDLVVFPDTEPIQALQAILEHRPSLIVLERMFAATPRGAALINRIKNDPQLGHAEVRVMSHSGDYRRIVAKPAGAARPPEAPSPETGSPGEESAVATEAPPAPAATVAEPPSRPLDWHGTRRAPRHRLRQGVEIQLDGNPAQVIDLSQVGAQVISQTILRPNQRVRVSVPNDDFVMRFRGAIAWAKFELPNPSAPPRYRAGVEFTDADGRAVEAYCQKNKDN